MAASPSILRRRYALGGCACVSAFREPQVRQRHGAVEDFPPRGGAFGWCPLQGQRATSPRVVGGMVVVWEVTLRELMRHVFSGGHGGVQIAVFCGGCARVILLGLGQMRRLCIGCGVRQSAVREDIGALGGELEDSAPFSRLLWGPLVGFALWLVEGDLVAPSPAVVGKEAEDGVLL